ncbi:MAG: hypothetical protein HZA36_03315 [Parcubacteria group bacterium]|nr:hypothetical protein [Parcubacteria group bacterium]
MTNINSGLFRKERVQKYMEINKLEKPRLVQKSKENTLVLANEIVVETGLVKNKISPEYQYQYIDKTH